MDLVSALYHSSRSSTAGAVDEEVINKCSDVFFVRRQRMPYDKEDLLANIDQWTLFLVKLESYGYELAGWCLVDRQCAIGLTRERACAIGMQLTMHGIRPYTDMPASLGFMRVAFADERKYNTELNHSVNYTESPRRFVSTYKTPVHASPRKRRRLEQPKNTTDASAGPGAVSRADATADHDASLGAPWDRHTAPAGSRRQSPAPRSGEAVEDGLDQYGSNHSACTGQTRVLDADTSDGAGLFVEESALPDENMRRLKLAIGRDLSYGNADERLELLESIRRYEAMKCAVVGFGDFARERFNAANRKDLIERKYNTS